MEINILHLLDGAKNARGLTVIIDVFRAFSTACFAFDSGAVKIFPVAEIEEAFQLKHKDPDFVLVGERDGKKLPGFDFGNSPSQIITANVKNKTIVHTTSSGTQGIANTNKADEVITGCFVNAGAIIKYIRKKQPKTVSLVCMGYACLYPTDEDTLCAEYIKNELENRPNRFDKMIETIKSGSGARFFKPENQSWSPQSDFELCLDINRFDFVLRVENKDGLNYLSQIKI